jgi:hypothetical protein
VVRSTIPETPDSQRGHAPRTVETCDFCGHAVMAASGATWGQCASCDFVTRLDQSSDLHSCSFCREARSICGGCSGWYCDRVWEHYVAEVPCEPRLPVERGTRCDIALFSQDANLALPDHVCHGAIKETVRRFQDEYLGRLYPRSGLMSDAAMASGPIPAGTESLAVLADRFNVSVDTLLPPPTTHIAGSLGGPGRSAARGQGNGAAVRAG